MNKLVVVSRWLTCLRSTCREDENIFVLFWEVELKP